MTDQDYRCPDCGGRVGYDLTCHTWPQTQAGGRVQWMSCLPCDSAIEYYCMDCDWSYVHGLNPGNPRAEANEAKRPSWFVEPERSTYGAVAMSGVPFYYDLDDVPQEN